MVARSALGKGPPESEDMCTAPHTTFYTSTLHPWLGPRRSFDMTADVTPIPGIPSQPEVKTSPGTNKRNNRYGCTRLQTIGKPSGIGAKNQRSTNECPKQYFGGDAEVPSGSELRNQGVAVCRIL